MGEERAVAINRKARFEYRIEEVIEAGMVLMGTEVKSLRAGRAQIADAYASVKGGELWLWNAHIEEFSHGNRYNHEPKRGRKLLVSARQLQKIIGQLKVRGTTLIPLKLYFNQRGYAKIQLGLAHGKTKYEKRDTIKTRDWKREQGRLLRK
ncbi:MAG: SsrA-binding protein SmpB [Alphaproteobacteria bacterium]|jgi:SsrA-binding protein|nr:SsrA-binding protein SmpB [Rickettsiales bacterium]